MKIIIGDLQLVFVMLTLFIMCTQLRSWFLLLTLPPFQVTLISNVFKMSTLHLSRRYHFVVPLVDTALHGTPYRIYCLMKAFCIRDGGPLKVRGDVGRTLSTNSCTLKALGTGGLPFITNRCVCIYLLCVSLLSSALH